MGRNLGSCGLVIILAPAQPACHFFALEASGPSLLPWCRQLAGRHDPTTAQELTFCRQVHDELSNLIGIARAFGLSGIWIIHQLVVGTWDELTHSAASAYYSQNILITSGQLIAALFVNCAHVHVTVLSYL